MQHTRGHESRDGRVLKGNNLYIYIFIVQVLNLIELKPNSNNFYNREIYIYAKSIEHVFNYLHI